MAIRLSDIKNIATIVKMKYGDMLNKMSFIFCCKIDRSRYFIFQEIQAMPIQRLIYNDSNTSVVFVAGWSAWSNPYALVSDANFDKIENWKDLLDRSRSYNSYIKIDGGFDTFRWRSINRENRKEKKKVHKTKFDTFVEFRIEKIERATFNYWGFELFSPTLSLIAIWNKGATFPYQILEEIEEASQSIDEDGLEEVSVVSAPISKVTWQGKSFNIEEKTVSNPSYSYLSHSQGEYNQDSYWDKNEFDEVNDLFDEEIANKLLADKEDDETIFDVGQRSVDLDL